MAHSPLLDLPVTLDLHEMPPGSPTQTQERGPAHPAPKVLECLWGEALGLGGVQSPPGHRDLASLLDLCLMGTGMGWQWCGVQRGDGEWMVVTMVMVKGTRCRRDGVTAPGIVLMENVVGEVGDAGSG